MHWSQAYAPSGQANPLVSSAVDGRSGQPEFKHTPSRARAYGEAWRGFFISRAAWVKPDDIDVVWRRIPQTGCQLHEFAGRGGEAERDALRAALTAGAPGDPTRFEDVHGGVLREAFVEAGGIERVLFMTTGARLPPREWLVGLFGDGRLSPEQRAALLIGREPGVAVETGPVICSCRTVRVPPIEAAITGGARTLAEVGEITGAGVTCGSCRPEIARMLARAHTPELCDVT